jgi:hypothetical protein
MRAVECLGDYQDSQVRNSSDRQIKRVSDLREVPELEENISYFA